MLAVAGKSDETPDCPDPARVEDWPGVLQPPVTASARTTADISGGANRKRDLGMLCFRFFSGVAVWASYSTGTRRPKRVRHLPSPLLRTSRTEGTIDHADRGLTQVLQFGLLVQFWVVGIEI